MHRGGSVIKMYLSDPVLDQYDAIKSPSFANHLSKIRIFFNPRYVIERGTLMGEGGGLN